MRSVNSQIVLSPSDLMRFQECAHATLLTSPICGGIRLLDLSCGTIAELRIVNALCATRDYACRQP